MSLQTLIRPATEDDIEQIARLHKGLNRPSRVHYRAGEFLVAFSGATLVGCAGTALNKDAAYFYGLAVARDWQRLGIGSRLMQARLDVLPTTRARFAVALVMFWNTRFFRKFLFRTIKRTHLPESARMFDDLVNSLFRRSAVMLRPTLPQ